MKLNIYSLALILGFSTFTSCADRLELIILISRSQAHLDLMEDDLERLL